MAPAETALPAEAPVWSASLERHAPLWRARVERALERWLPGETIHPSRLHRAMRYAMLGGGKRIRPLLVYATAQAVGIPAATVDGCACAVELIHGYSLVHDDLPAMDDDDLRRGRPTCHRAFDEATAILAGDALQALAFYVLAHDPDLRAGDGVRTRMIAELALAAGSRGMAGGQAIDLAAQGRELDLAQLEDMHIHKTGALIRAAVRLAAQAAPGLDPALLGRLDRYAKCVGLAFQIRDDILDVTGDTRTLGKRAGADAARDKPTYPTLLGLEGARERARELLLEALEALAPWGEEADPLRGLACHAVFRNA